MRARSLVVSQVGAQALMMARETRQVELIHGGAHPANISAVDDTMLMSFCINGGRHGHGMDSLSTRYLNHDPIPIKELIGIGKSAVTFDKVSIEKATTYASEDADITLRLWSTFKPSLIANRVTTVYETMERPLISVLKKMEENGIVVDRKHLQDMSNKLAQKMTRLAQKFLNC